jgi:CBS domain containing-hemolysin-like protein
MVHIKDVLAYWGTAKKFNLRDILRRVVFVAPTLPVLDMLLDMRRSRTHMALVVDEFGGTDGLLTIEDLVEEIVGEIEDEFDVPEEQVEQVGDDTFRVDGMFSIDDFNERFGTELPQEDFHTVAGFVFGQLGRAPEPGDDVSYDGMRFDVLEVEGNRIERIVVTFLERPERRDDPVEQYVDEDEVE